MRSLMRRYRAARTLRLLALLLVGSMTATVTAALSMAHLNNNLHVIQPGVAYRSAQPDAAHLAEYRSQLGIRSIINLRGASPGKAWYDEEVAAAKRLGMAHWDFTMDAHQALTPRRSAELIALMRAAPKPVLIHCKAGSDRTGLAAAFYLATLSGTDEEVAEGQMALRFGHIALPLIGTYAMDASFEAIEPLIGFLGS